MIAVKQAVLTTTEGVEMHLDPLKPEMLIGLPHQVNALHLCFRKGASVPLDSKLRVLAESAGLGTLIPEHRLEIKDSRLGAWASPQSQVISSRAVLVANAAKYSAQFLLQPPRPPHWGGYRLQPDRFEFWQGRPSRLHDRLRYRLQNGVWIKERLAP